MKIYIKNMISNRCKVLVKETLETLGINADVKLGKIELHSDIKPSQKDALRSTLKYSGFDIIEDKKSLLIEKIKLVIYDMIHVHEELPAENYSCYISSKLGLNYTYLANLFSEMQGITIEHYIINNKIEKVKELLIADELSLTQIADLLHYSSVAHLSNQFKKVTGITASSFKNQ